MRHLSHKCADEIYEHDFDKGPLTLYGGYSDEFESLLWYVHAVARKSRLKVTFRNFRSAVTISKVV